MPLTRQERHAISALAPWADIASSVVECLSRPGFPRVFDEGTLCSEAALPQTQAIAIIGLLRAMIALGLVRETHDMRWERLADEQVFRALVPLFEAVSFYRRQVHQDRTTAEVVLTRPGEPSLLEKALEEFGFRAGLMELTAEAFGDLAVSATKSLVVMTPFLDLHGGAWLAKLLKQAKPSVKKTLILRYVAQPAHPGHPEGLEAIRHAIADLGVQVFDYAIPRPTGGFETFHAKVVVSDDAYAYVGSANMNRASLEYSMELGVLLRGDAARKIAEILRAITRACGANA